MVLIFSHIQYITSHGARHSTIKHSGEIQTQSTLSGIGFGDESGYDFVCYALTKGQKEKILEITATFSRNAAQVARRQEAARVYCEVAPSRSCRARKPPG